MTLLAAGGQQEEEHGVVHQVQVEHYQLSWKGFNSLSDSWACPCRSITSLVSIFEDRDEIYHSILFSYLSQPAAAGDQRQIQAAAIFTIYTASKRSGYNTYIVSKSKPKTSC